LAFAALQFQYEANRMKSDTHVGTGNDYPSSSPHLV